MYLLGAEDKPVDILNHDNIGKKIFEFCPQKEDYFLNFYFNWEKIKSEVFVFKAGRITFQIPSGFFLFIGSPCGMNDWIMVDEIIDRDIEVFVMPTSLGSWTLQKFQLIDVLELEYIYPQTKNPIPLLDQSGRLCVISSPADQYHKFKNKDDGTLFVL